MSDGATLIRSRYGKDGVTLGILRANDGRGRKLYEVVYLLPDGRYVRVPLVTRWGKPAVHHRPGDAYGQLLARLDFLLSRVPV